jgi:hypothetical protein
MATYTSKGVANTDEVRPVVPLDQPAAIEPAVDVLGLAGGGRREQVQPQRVGETADGPLARGTGPLQSGGGRPAFRDEKP